MTEPSLGENVRWYRKKMKRDDGSTWRQEDLAAAAGVSTRAINMLEQGSEGTKLATILDVAKALHLHPADLFRRQSAEAVPGGEASQISRIEIPPQALRDALVEALRELAAAPGTSARPTHLERLQRARAKQAADADRKDRGSGTRGSKRSSDR